MRRAILCCCTCAVLLGARPAAAQDIAPQDDLPMSVDERGAVLYTGLGLSWVTADFSNLSSAVNLDLAVGAHVPRLRWLSGEIDLSFTVMPGDNSGASTTTTGATACVVPPSALDPDGTPDGCGTDGVTVAEPGQTTSPNDLQMTNLGVFGAVRTPGKVYALGKFGYRYITASIDELNDADRAGTAYSLGGGYRWGAGLSQLELAYTKYSSQLDFFGLNVAYGFGATPDAGAGAP